MYNVKDTSTLGLRDFVPTVQLFFYTASSVQQTAFGLDKQHLSCPPKTWANNSLLEDVSGGKCGNTQYSIHTQQRNTILVTGNNTQQHREIFGGVGRYVQFSKATF